MNLPMDVAAIILAAGKSSRMGDFKPLLSLGGDTALERLVTLFSDAGIEDIRVITGHKGDMLRQQLPDLPVTFVHNDAFEEGMLSSIRKGISALGAKSAWFFLLPVDIPLVRGATLSALISALRSSKGSALIPTFQGRRGHPPLLSQKLIPGICAWNGPGGLGGFLDSLPPGEIEDLPVIDEFILRDMDTPSDHRGLCAAASRHHIPTNRECEAMLSNPSFFKDHTAAHCRMVARLAGHFARALSRHHVFLDIPLITAGALLHDIAKGEKNHAETGGALLRSMGFHGIAHIVSAHMDMVLSDDPRLTEAQLVFLADKLLKGSTPVTLSQRFDQKLARYGHDPQAREAILRRRSVAETLIRRIEKATARPFQTILDDFSGEHP